MPGIWGTCHPAHQREMHGSFGARMAERLRHSDLYRSAVTSGEHFVSGAVTLPEVKDPVWSDPDGQLPSVVVDGEIYEGDRLRRELEARGAVFQTTGAAELIAKGWHLGGTAFLKDIEGYFAAAVWDPSTTSLMLLTDRFGMRPLYYCRLPDGALTFATEIKALLQYPQVSAAPSLDGVAQFLTFGHLFGEDTLLKDVQTAPAAAQLRFDPREEKLTMGVYARFGRNIPLIRSQADAFEQLDAAFGRAVTRRIAGDLPLGLSLSGGLDARTILATTPKQSALTTVSLGIPGCIDHRAATRLAALSGREHHTHHLDRNFLADFPRHLQRMTFLTDGQYLDQGITVPSLGIYRDLGIGALLRGHAGELFHMDKAYAFSIRADELNFQSLAEVERWLWTHLTHYMIDGVGMQMFRSQLRGQAEAAARGALTQALRESEGVTPPAQAMWLLFVTQRLRRETALSMQMFNAFVQVRLPYLDSELVDLIMQVPPEWKMGERIQSFILRRRFPEFLDVVNANTGARVGASARARRLSHLKLRIFSKLRVPGYQPYERLGLWLSRDLQPFVRSTLLAAENLDQGLLDPDVVRQMVDDHSNRRRNHTFPLMAMLILALGRRPPQEPPLGQA